MGLTLMCGPVFDIQIDATYYFLYVVGAFTSNLSNYFAAYNPFNNTWFAPFNQGTGFDAPVRAIARLDSNNTYFVGGQFSCYDMVGGICLTMTTWGIVAYDPVTYRYTTLADNFVATSVTLDAIAIDQIGGVIYVAGYAIFSNDVSRANQSNSVLAYDGIKWFQVGEFNSPTEKLYARTYASLYFVQSTGTLYGLFDELASPIVQLDE